MKKMPIEIKYNSNGYVTILAVLVLLVVTGGIATTLMFSSVDAIGSQEALRQGEEALFFSESCLEESFLQIVKNPLYGGGTFTMPQGECEVSIENNGGIYTVYATGKNNKFERRLIAEASLDVEKLTVGSWREE